MRTREGDQGWNRPPVVARRPNDRHYYNRIKQNTKASKLDTVMDPRVDVSGDVAAINRGEAIRRGDTDTFRGRSYVLEATGTLSPRDGDGFYVLTRGAFRALGVYKTFGDSERADAILDNMHNVGPAERNAAMAVVRAITGED